MSVETFGAGGRAAGMSPRPHVATAGFWTLNRVLGAFIAAAFGFLFVDVRYEHRLLSGSTVTVLPILYAAGAACASLASLAFWHRGGRQLLAILSVLSVLLGVAGVWYHTEGNLRHLAQVVAPAAPPAAEQDEEARALALMAAAETPSRPLVAPLAFAGVGFLGILATLRRFEQK